MKTTIIKKIITISAAAMLVGVTAGGAFAFSAADVTKLKTTKSCAKPCDLSGADLTSLTIINANLAGANMSGANLTGANFSSAAMSQTNLTGATLSGANLTYCKMSGANLTSAVVTSTTDLSGSTMSYAKWTDGSTLPNGSVGFKNNKPKAP